jgi:mitochondrial fission protein ELM1
MDDVSKASTASVHPRVWAVLSYRAGENSQILALAEALGWGYETKRLAYRWWGFIPNLARRVSLAGIDPAYSSPLSAPWPDLIISAGLRNEPVCRWIKQASGGRTRLVFIGRTWINPPSLDLLITTPQYRVPENPRVLQNRLTLQGLSEEKLRQAAEGWRRRITDLSPPYIAVLLGGNSGPYTFGPRAARRLATELNALSRSKTASLLITTSSRTPTRAAGVLADSLEVPHEFHHWQPDAQDNPYLAYLGLAEEIVVTGDSIAMLSEACATGKPVLIFDPGVGPQAMHRGEPARRSGGNDFRLTAWLYRLLMTAGPRRLSRDIRVVHDWLTRSGRAAWLGEGHAWQTEPPTDRERSVQRVRELVFQESDQPFSSTALPSARR